jgi:uncharacterized membrane protein YkgB
VKKNKVVELASAFLILLFFYNALDAFINLQSVKNLLRILPFTYNKYQVVAWVIVIVQFAIALLAFFPKTRLYGFSLAIVWSISIISFLLYTPKWPHEFAGVYNYLYLKQQITLSVFTIVLAIIGLVLLKYKGKKKPEIPKIQEVAFT